MNPKEPFIIVNMIVKDEEFVVTRALDSVRDFADCFVISDTGSIDNTLHVIRDYMKDNDLLYYLNKDPWYDFATNRNLAFDFAQNIAATWDDVCVPWVLFLDADDSFIHNYALNSKNIREHLHDDLIDPNVNALSFEFSNESLSFRLRRMVRLTPAITWKWKGRTHEHIEADLESRVKERHITGAYFHYGCDGGSRKNKFQRDLELLQQDYEEDPTNSRTLLYLANTHRDLGNTREALKFYQDRFSAGGWEEEVQYALWQAMICKIRLGYSQSEIQEDFFTLLTYSTDYRAYYVTMMEYFCSIQEYEKAFLFGYPSTYVTRSAPLFEDKSYYWKSYDLFALACFYLGKYFHAKNDWVNVLNTFENLPEKDKQRIKKNLTFIPDNI